MSKQERVNFNSKLGMILATAGSAVGLGNVWRFPYMAGENGGAAFIIIYIACVVLLGIPCMLNEFVIGRHGASNTARAYTSLARGSAWKWLGFLAVLTGFLITGYYSVVSGWCLQYVFGTAVGQMHGGPDYFSQYFSDFSANPWQPILWAAVFLVITHLVVSRGVEKGIERVSKLLMPTLFILLLIVMVASCLLPGAGRGISFLLQPDFSKITGEVFLAALGQAFYSLSIAMGCVCTYASYFKRSTPLLSTAVKISVIDCVVAILAGLMIFPAAFAVGVSPDSGPSLVFITLPNVFEQAFSGVPFLGTAMALVFYVLLSLAALTSLISLHEVSTAFLHEELHVSRKRAAAMVTVACIVIGGLCSLSLGVWEGLHIGNLSLFDVFDFVTGQIFLPIGGFLTCLFVGWYLPRRLVRDEFTNGGTLRGTLFAVYLFLIRWICPLCILVIFLHQLKLF